MRRLATLHPLLFAAYPIVRLYAHNADSVSAGDLWAPWLACTAGTVLLWAAAAALLRDVARGARVASTGVFAFTAYGYVRSGVEIALGAPLYPLGESALLLAYTALAAGLCALLARRGPGLEPVLAAVGLVLVALPAGSLALSREARPLALGDAGPVAPARSPDVYYIVLDGYGSTEVLRRIYGFDNRPFVEWLRSRGFFVAERSRANYGRTSQSLASSLNFTYLDAVAEQVGPGSRRRGVLKQLIVSSRLARLLRQRGYRVVAFETGFAATELMGSERYLSPGAGFGEFANAALRLTPLPLLLGPLGPTDGHALHRRRVRFALEGLAKVAGEPGPKLVFAHVVSPHPPFVFDAEGRPVDSGRAFDFGDGKFYLLTGRPEDYVEGYRGQVAFVTREVQEAIDGILENSAAPPIIVVQGDHGPGLGLDQDRFDATDFSERMPILNALHLPGGGDAALYPEISPVNTFRVVLRHYFGFELPLLEDRSYFSARLSPHAYEEVPRVEPARDGVDAR